MSKKKLFSKKRLVTETKTITEEVKSERLANSSGKGIELKQWVIKCYSKNKKSLEIREENCWVLMKNMPIWSW